MAKRGKGPTRREFRDAIAALALELRDRIEAEVDGFSVDPRESAKRVAGAARDFRFFCRTYFPHVLTSETDSVLHQWLFNRLPRIVETERGVKLALAAPRGEAKTTLAVTLFVLWCLCYRLKWFIVIISDALDQADAIVEAIKAELEFNPRLKADFPDVAGAGRVWKQGVMLTRTNAKVQAFGSGKRLRGVKHGHRRPDLGVGDDLENDENVRSREQRKKLKNWLVKAVLKLGPPDDSMDFILVGSIIRHESVLAQVIRMPLWEGRVFRAVIKWPGRMDLWEKWEEILVNKDPDHPERAERDADAFYAANKAAMEAGAEVSWPEVRPLELLMKIRARDGHAAFDSEFQNSPLAENALFKTLHWWVASKREWVYYGALDPSLGKGERGDPSAILVGGYDRNERILDVVEAAIRPRTPTLMIQHMIAFQREVPVIYWAVESVAFQEILVGIVMDAAADAGILLPAGAWPQTLAKELRISSIEPFVTGGRIRLNKRHGVLIDQLMRYGEPGMHDDGPDALEMLYKAAIARSAYLQGLGALAAQIQAQTDDGGGLTMMGGAYGPGGLVGMGGGTGGLGGYGPGR